MIKKLVIDAYMPQRHFTAKSNSIHEFKKRYPQAIIQEVDGTEVRATCVMCRMPVYVSETAIQDQDGACWHDACPSHPGLKARRKKSGTRKT